MAATDLEKLVVQLSADIKKYENTMRRAQAITNKELGNIQKKADTVSKGIGLSFARSGAAIVAGLATGVVARELLKLSEAATRIDNSLKVAGLSGAELESVYKSLSNAARANGAQIETLAGLYSKAALAQKELGVTSTELTTFTNNVALALRVAGTDATAASGALQQLGQALGGGVVRAEEFNSILEGAPTIAQAAAAGLKEAGGSVSKLRELMLDGAISSEAFFRAFEAGAPVLEEKVKNSTFTVSQAMENLNTAMIDAVREFNAATGASESFADGINNLAGAVDSVDFGTLIGKIKEARAALDDFFAGLDFTALGQALGVITEDGLAVNLEKEEAEEKVQALEREVEMLQATIEKNTNLGFDNTEALARIGEVVGALNVARAAAAAMSDTAAMTKVVPGVGLVQMPDTGGSTNGSMGGSSSRGGARRAVAVNPVSLADFKIPAGKSGGGGGGGGSAKKGRSGGESDYQREIEQIKERTAALQAETAAQATVNPLIDDYGFASERASVAQDLLTAAQNSGLAAGKELTSVQQLLAGDFSALSPAAQQQAQAMLQLANGYATASTEAEKLAEAQANAKDAANDFKSLAKDVVGGFISDLREGKSATEALGNALDKITEKLLDMALNAAFDGLFGGGGGLLGGIFGGGGGGGQFGIASGGGLGLYDKGGYTGAGGKYQPAGIVHKGEYVMDAEATKRIGVENLRKLQGYANGGMVGGAPSMPSLSRPSAANDNIEIKIINNNGSQVSQSQRKTSSGQSIEMVIDDMVAGKMSTPGSRTRSTVASQFGLKSGLAKR